jgi:hypothetical protein
MKEIKQRQMTIKKTDLLVTAKQFLKTNLSEFK